MSNIYMETTKVSWRSMSPILEPNFFLWLTVSHNAQHELVLVGCNTVILSINMEVNNAFELCSIALASLCYENVTDLIRCNMMLRWSVVIL